MNEKGLQIGLYIVSAMSILTGFVTLPSGGIVAVVSGIGGIILTVLLSKRTKELNKTINDKDYEIQCLNNSVVNNTSELVALKRHQEELGFTTYDETKAAADTLQKLIESYNQTIEKLRDSILEQTELSEKAEKRLKTAQNKLNRISELYRSISYTVREFGNGSDVEPLASDLLELDDLLPTVTLKLHCFDVKDLRKAFRANDKQIEQVMQAYAARYTTKTNQTIYRLMVIALRAELQNILLSLKYEKLDQGIEDVKKVTAKYLAIAEEGNQNIAGTLKKFVGEIEYLFINAVKIEYNYYVKKEQARQEQLAIREQMRQEAEDRKALAEEKRKIEAEETKYNNEIQALKEKLSAANSEEVNLLRARILELESQLSDVAVKKDSIIKLQNGTAGNIYIISNLGSFGDNVFKIGMTRRLYPQDRVDELGSASVPFKFDVHSFIFSDNAVALENALHSRLDAQRVNKVNRRKEFFYSSADELEAIVNEIDPTAEFNKTMMATEFRQSLSSNETYTDDYRSDVDFEDDDDLIKKNPRCWNTEGSRKSTHTMRIEWIDIIIISSAPAKYK